MASDETERLGRQFRLLLASAASSNLGDGIRYAALPLLAVGLTDDPVLVAGVTAATFLPGVLFGPVGGAVVDRHDRRRLIVWGQLLRGVAVAAFAVLVLLDGSSIWAVYALAAVLGAGEVVVDSASQAAVPALVGPSLLERANARLISAQLVLDDVVGAAVGGILFAVGPALPFLADAVTFLVGGAGAAAIDGPLEPADDPEDAPATEESMWQAVRAGVDHLANDPLLRGMAAAVGLSNLAAVTGGSVLVLLVVDELGASEATFGLVLAVGAVCGALASAGAARLVARVGRRPVLLGACVVDGVGLAVVAGAPNVWVVAAGLGLVTAGIVTFNVPALAVRQEVTPDRLLGRVVSSFRVVGWAGVPLGALLGGVVTDLAGVRTAYLTAAAMLVVVTVLMARAARHLPEGDRDDVGGATATV